MDIRVGAKTDVGLKRSHNEDTFCADPRLGLFVVCDGMGGCNAGEVASQLALEMIQKHIAEASENPDLPMVGPYDPRYSAGTNRLASAARLANETVYRSGQSWVDYEGMGTTVVSALLNEGVMSIAHVGDSRLYLVRGGDLIPVTRDHSLVAEQVRRGLLTEEEAERSAQRNIITRALGTSETVEVTLNEVNLIQGDALLLCSDGLTRGVTSSQILAAILAAPDPQTASQHLVALANKAGGEDNTTVIVIMIQKIAAQEGWSRVSNG